MYEWPVRQSLAQLLFLGWHIKVGRQGIKPFRLRDLKTGKFQEKTWEVKL
jgi:hypothetical protein